jgi:hypothetical protein
MCKRHWRPITRDGGHGSGIRDRGPPCRQDIRGDVRNCAPLSRNGTRSGFPASIQPAFKPRRETFDFHSGMAEQCDGDAAL